jgi:molybdopterin adenylyltransferase
MGTHSHRKKAPQSVNVGIITMSTSRTLADDKSGLWIKKRALREGHRVVTHMVVPDQTDAIIQAVVHTIHHDQPDVLICTGGTGITPQDVTIEAIQPMLTKELTAFNTLFAMLSYEQIDAAALLSRAVAGVINRTLIFCIPGSINACKLACKALIFPDLGHFIGHIHETAS